MLLRPIKDFNIKVARDLSQLRGFCWIDSATGGDFSVLAWDPVEDVRFDAPEEGGAFLDFLKRLSLRGPAPAKIPFAGGWIGYMAYEAFAFSPNIPFKPRFFKDYPLARFRRYETLICRDHRGGESYFVSRAPDAERRFEDFLGLHAASRRRPANESPQPSRTAAGARPQMNVDRPRYRRDFEAVKRGLGAGDFFELNYTVEFSAAFAGDAFGLYLALRQAAPAPYMAFLDFGRDKILSASPECFFSLRDDEIRTFPIKGTSPRGGSPEDDARLAEELLASPKERAELLMVTDMLRNDLGRVCRAGSVRTERVAQLASFSRYHHLFSEIRGTLRGGADLSDIFAAVFPGGSVTGAPKIQVMREIERLEARARGVYTGAVGLVGDDGFAEFNIPIRTLTLGGDRAEFAVGGGLVADSVCDREYEECLLKASGLLAALEPAQPARESA